MKKGLEPTAEAQPEYAGQRDMEQFWAEVAPRREPLQKKWFLPLVVLLLAISVPWYLPQGFVGRLYGGLPVWIWIALVCSAAIASLTAFVALRHWDDGPAGEEEE